MSFDDIFDQFDEEKKEDKTVPKESVEASKTSESESVPIPEEGEEPKEEDEEEALAKDTPATETVAKGDDDWFEPAKEEPTKDKPVEEQVTEKEASEEAPAEEPIAEAVDDWFAPAMEEPTKDKLAEDQPIEKELVKEKVDEDSTVEETPEAETPAEAVDDWFEPSEDQTTAETPSEEIAGAIVPMSVEASPIVLPAVTAGVMRESMRQFQSLKASLLDKSDIATIKNKPFIKRSGWRKLSLAFNLSDAIIKEERDDFEGGFRWRMWVMVTAPNGRSVVGVAGCSSEERDFAHLEHDVYSICHTRAKNRALSDMIGSGEVSWEELRGMN